MSQVGTTKELYVLLRKADAEHGSTLEPDARADWEQVKANWNVGGRPKGGTLRVFLDRWLAQIPEQPEQGASATSAEEHYERLKAAAGNKTATDRKEIKWAKDNLIGALSDIDIENVPSKGAVSWLKIAREAPGKFPDYAIKLLGKAPDEEAGKKFEDDGRKRLEGMERLKAEGNVDVRLGRTG
jgi:hypothetical protein